MRAVSAAVRCVPTRAFATIRPPAVPSPDANGKFKVTLFPGDGIGPEISEAVVNIIQVRRRRACGGPRGRWRVVEHAAAVSCHTCQLPPVSVASLCILRRRCRRGAVAVTALAHGNGVCGGWVSAAPTRLLLPLALCVVRWYGMAVCNLPACLVVGVPPPLRCTVNSTLARPSSGSTTPSPHTR